MSDLHLEVTGLNPNCELAILIDFTHFLQENAGIVP
jgi:hypothetical protein